MITITIPEDFSKPKLEQAYKTHVAPFKGRFCNKHPFLPVDSDSGPELLVAPWHSPPKVGVVTQAQLEICFAASNSEPSTFTMCCAGGTKNGGFKTEQVIKKICKKQKHSLTRKTFFLVKIDELGGRSQKLRKRGLGMGGNAEMIHVPSQHELYALKMVSRLNPNDLGTSHSLAFNRVRVPKISGVRQMNAKEKNEALGMHVETCSLDADLCALPKSVVKPNDLALRKRIKGLKEFSHLLP